MEGMWVTAVLPFRLEGCKFMYVCTGRKVPVDIIQYYSGRYLVDYSCTMYSTSVICNFCILFLLLGSN